MLLCCTVYLPGFFSIPPVDRDESRFAQASRQMFESVALPEGERDAELHWGGLAVPMVGGKPRLNKPPLIYWLQAASAAVFTGGDPLGDAIWMYRVPSLLAGLAIVLATWRIGCSMFDPRAGWVAGALLAVSPVFVWEAHQARADMVMVACTTLAMGQLWEMWSARCATGGCRAPSGLTSLREGRKPRAMPWALALPRRWREETPDRNGPARGSPSPLSLLRSVAQSLLFWVFVALGVMTKGPITPLVVVLTAITLAIFSRKRPGAETPGGRALQPAGGLRWLGSTHPLLGLVLVIAAVAPWVYAVARQVGFASYWHIVSDEVFGRAGSAKEGHWGPPGYHLVLLVVLFWPGSLLTGLSIARAWRCGLQSRGRKHADGAVAGSGDVGATETGSRGSDGARLTEPSHTEQSRGRKHADGGEETQADAGNGDNPDIPTSPSASSRPRLRGLLPYLASVRVTRRPEAFLLAWMLPSWLVFELVGTKLPHYTMPLYPAVALITARGVFAAMSAALPGVERPVNRIGFAAWCVPGVLITLGLGAAAYSSLGGHWNERPPAWLLWGLQVVSLGAVGIAIGALRHRAWLGAYACGIVVSLCMSVGLLGGYLPRVDRVWFTTTLVKRATAADGGPIAASGFSEDSLVYLTRGRIQFVEPVDEGAWWASHPSGVMIMPWERVGRIHTVVGNVDGLRYTKGRFEQLAIVKRWWPPAAEPQQ